MAPVVRDSRPPRGSISIRALSRLFAPGLVLLLLAAACGSDPVTSTTTDDTDDGNLAEGCVEEHAAGTDYFPDKVDFEEASGVGVSYHEHYKVVDVAAPSLPEGTSERYVLVQCGTPAPELDGDLAGAQVVTVPVHSVVSLTTTNLPHFAELGIVDSLAGVGTGAYVTTPEVLERIEAGELPDFADATGQPDLERLVATAPDLLVMDGFGDAILEEVSRFVEGGVPTAINADFNERTLLGRAEWLKFTALFTNTEARANEVYDGIRERYRERQASVAQYGSRPKVLVNTPYEGTWFVPGGDSFLANAISDAGGEYVFAGVEGTGSLAYDIETVLDAATDADVWLQAGSVHGSLDDLLAIDERFAAFDAFSEGEVWAWDAWVTEGGGHAVFEIAYTRADLFLDDLVAALHPEARAGIDLTFFGQVRPSQ